MVKAAKLMSKLGPSHGAVGGIDVILASNHAGYSTLVAIYIDSLSSAGVLCGEPPSALLMRVIHFEIVALPKFSARAPTLVTGRCSGERNSCADLASRSRFDELEALWAALGVVPRRVAPNGASLDFVARV